MDNKKEEKLIEFLATGFYLGKSPKAPGTMGTLGAIPLWYLMNFISPLTAIMLTLSVIAVAIVVADKYEQFHDGHDHPEIVIDEIAGFLVAMALLPATWTYILFGFVIFRFLDIVKPYPISYLNDHVQGGLGVVVDDIAAGLVTNILLQILSQLYAR